MLVEKSVRYITEGALAWAEFFGPEGKPVSQELANQRALVCASCPLNRTAHGWIDTITKAAAKATKAYFLIRSALKLSTPNDRHLGVCDACWCPIKLKIHMPHQYIMEHTREEVLAELHKDCWITKES